MQLTASMKLVLTPAQEGLLDTTLAEYINTVNLLVAEFVVDGLMETYSSDVTANLPSALKNQAIRDAKSVFRKYTKALLDMARKPEKKRKEVKVPILKKPAATWNSQNFKLKGNSLSFPVWVAKSKRIRVTVIVTEYQRKLLEYKIGALRITKRNGKYIAQISVKIKPVRVKGNVVMGIDLGLKVPAVAYISTGKVKFGGNGRHNKYVRRKHLSRRKNLQAADKIRVIQRISNKEQRWMRDQDHKISRQVVDFAVANNVSKIRLEYLSGIRQTARTSRKNAKKLHTWSFYRLSQFIEYKAKLAGIQVEYVDPRYTSQTCPSCGTRNKARDRKYKCACGFTKHRDIVGAMNIISAPLMVSTHQPRVLHALPEEGQWYGLSLDTACGSGQPKNPLDSREKTLNASSGRQETPSGGS